jgi:hypothetical protein
MADATNGTRTRLVLEQLLPPGLVAGIAEGRPEAVLRMLAQVGRDERGGWCLGHCRWAAGGVLGSP